jgi:dTDP-4-amino-4,6-dideoxygalactose transaminase
MAEKISKQCLSLPIYPELPKKHVKSICNILNNYDG